VCRKIPPLATFKRCLGSVVEFGVHWRFLTSCLLLTLGDGGGCFGVFLYKVFVDVNLIMVSTNLVLVSCSSSFWEGRPT
jgi:hypothetical protein